MILGRSWSLSSEKLQGSYAITLPSFIGFQIMLYFACIECVCTQKTEKNIYKHVFSLTSEPKSLLHSSYDVFPGGKCRICKQTTK